MLPILVNNIEFMELMGYNNDIEVETVFWFYGGNGDIMATISKPINKVTVISEKESKNFVKEFNGNKVTKEFLNSCKKAGKLFGDKK